jgi:hypothetical protein
MSNMTFARLVLAASSNNRLPDTQNWNVPSKQEGLSIVQYYMTNIYSLYPSFPETTLYSLLDQVYNQQDKSVKDSDYWLVFMVLAIGSTAQSQSINDNYYMHGVHFVSMALRYADRALMPGYVTQIQSLILLTLYSMLDPAHFDSWHLVGFTCRAAVDLGFHQDPPPEQMPTKDQLDTRRKLFYCVYSLDRFVFLGFPALSGIITNSSPRSISMVQARAFSFTDAATNVAWPRAQSFSRRASITGQILSGSEPAFLLFQLRWAQSHWYQILFQSEPTAVPDSTSCIWQMCQDMREWAEALPTTLPVAMRELFDLELRYSYVYCLSARTAQMTNYRRLLIFEHTIAYLDRIFEISHGGIPNALYTSHDALRVFFMANHLVSVLSEAEDILLSGVTSAPPPTELGKPAPLPLPLRPGGPAVNNVERSLGCLERVIQTLARYGQRWDDSSTLQQAFEMHTGDLIGRLRVRQQMRQRTSPPQQYITQPMPREMKWVDVDVQAMMRGNRG